MINIINISPVLSTFVSNVIQKQTFLLEREGVEVTRNPTGHPKRIFSECKFLGQIMPKN